MDQLKKQVLDSLGETTRLLFKLIDSPIKLTQIQYLETRLTLRYINKLLISLS